MPAAYVSVGFLPVSAGSCGWYPLDDGYQAADVSSETFMPHRKGLETGKAAEALRQIIRAGHHRVLREDWNNPHVTDKGGPDFQSDVVTGVIDARTASFIGRGQPLRADDCQQHLAACHRPVNLIGEVTPRFDRFHIHKDPVFAETSSQVIRQTAS